MNALLQLKVGKGGVAVNHCDGGQLAWRGCEDIWLAG